MSTRTYLPTHEWMLKDGDTVSVGISEFAQSELGDVIYVDLPEVGSRVEAGQIAATVESIKAVSDVYSPVSGTVIKQNESLEDDPSLVNESPLQDGWFFQLQPDSDEASPNLLSEDEYLAKHGG